MNVKRCRNGTKGQWHCVYKVRRRDPETGKIRDYGCIKHQIGTQDTAGVDWYNIFPEHDESSGNAIYQQRSSEPNCFRTGPTLIWENISGKGQNGLNYDLREFEADIHPLYRKEEYNIPSNSFLSEDDIGEIFGETDPILVNTGWNNERWIGINNVDICNEGIYGPYNAISDMVLPKCFKSYARDIYNWINFTNKKEVFKPRTHYLSEMNKEEIAFFCKNTFGAGSVAERMNEALLYIKRGNYLNIWTLMCNNFVSRDIKKKFMDSISMRSKNDLYKGTINIRQYCQLYGYIDKIRHNATYIDINGKEIKETKYLPNELIKLYKENLINFILNYPALQKSLNNTSLNNMAEKYATNQRYWFIVPLLKRAKKEGILNTKVKLPTWLVNIIKEESNPSFKLFGIEYDYKSAPADIKKEYDEANYLRLNGPQNLYPGIIHIKSQLDTKGYDVGWYTFCDILHAGRIWNIAEIKLAWEFFKPAWIREEPRIFWDWVEKIVELPYDTEFSISEEEYEKIIKKVNGKCLHIPDTEQVLEYGATDFNIGEGRVSQGRAFAMNLINQMYDYDSWEVQKQPISNSYDAIARVKLRRECNHETFWTMLARIGGLKNDREEVIRKISKGTYKEAIVQDLNVTYEEAMENAMEGIANLDGIDEVGLSDSDLHIHEAYNPLSGEYKHLNGSIGSWLEEE